MISEQRKIELQKELDKFNEGIQSQWWYQPIKFCDGLMTHSYKWSDDVFYKNSTFGENKWNNYISKFLPINLKDKVILDIGSNAGYFLLKSVKNGAKLAYGIEPNQSCGNQFNNGFDKQHKLVIDIFSEVDGINYSRKIKLISKEMHNIDWLKNIGQAVDITFAFNVLYWLTFSDEKGNIKNARIKLQEIINNIARNSKWFFIICDEATERFRLKTKRNFYCTGISQTKPFLKHFDIITEWKEQPPKDREVSIIIAKSKIHGQTK